MQANGRAGLHYFLHSLLTTSLSFFMSQPLLSFNFEFNSVMFRWHESRSTLSCFCALCLSVSFSFFLAPWIISLSFFLSFSYPFISFVSFYVLWGVNLISIDVSIITSLFSSFIPDLCVCMHV